VPLVVFEMSRCTDYRMIAIDLDGTLLDPRGQVTTRVRRAVHELISQGWIVCFATGRNYLESRPVLEQVGHFDHAVFVGGAVVIDTREGITLHQQKMEPALAQGISRILEDLGHAVLALQDSSAAGADYFATAGVALDDATERWMKAFGIRLTPLPSLADHDHAHTIRLGIVGQAGETADAERRIKERYAERVLCHSLKVLGDVEVLECFDPAVNKWEGIKQVARHHGIDQTQIIAVGDDWNDLAMIRSAGLGVAMGNARDQIKAVAKRVIGANCDEGLAVFLEELAGKDGQTSCSCEDPDEVAA
jgi:5-amino-6-(5-phospho-D-ribitylamino)uracil phosphatase